MQEEKSSRWQSGTGYALLLVIVLYWTRIIFSQQPPSAEPPWIFLDYVNLIFHEAGHWIFLPFGDFLHVLGGSLTQVLIPLIVMGGFIRQRSWFAVGFALFWAGENLANVSYYIADARARDLPLLGGDSSGHDWFWLLDHLNRLSSDLVLGHLVYDLGAACVICGILWMAYALFRVFFTVTLQ